MGRKTHTEYHSSSSGRFASKGYAGGNPERTPREQMPKRGRGAAGHGEKSSDVATKRASGVDELEQVAAYHRELQLCLREHESKFDNAVLLVAGGAFTISAAFISDLATPLHAGAWLATSWLAWGLCLLAGVGGHLVGAHATKRVLDLLDSQVYDFHVLMAGKAAKLIKPINVSTFASLIVGFIAFGRFTFSNLDFERPRKEEQKRSKEEGREEGPAARAARAFVPSPIPRRPHSKDRHASEGNHVRQEDASTTPPATTSAKTDSEARSSTADSGEADRAHGTKPAAGLAPAPLRNSDSAANMTTSGEATRSSQSNGAI